MSKINLKEVGEKVVENVQKAAMERAYPASNELRNAAMFILRGQRSGREYRVPGSRKKYRASSPGEPPAVRTGVLRASWTAYPTSEKEGDTLKILPQITSKVPYIKYLEPELSGREPGEKVRPRPFVKAIKQRAQPRISSIYKDLLKG